MNWIEKSSSSGPQLGMRATKATFEPVAFFVVAVLFGWFMVRPAWTGLDAVKLETTRLESDKQLLIEKQEQLNNLTRQLTTKKVEIERLEELLPTDLDPASLYYLVEKMALNTGLLGTSVNVVPEPKEVVAGSTETEFAGRHELREISFTVRGNGTIDQLQGLLKNIESAPRLMELENLEISSASTGQLIFTLQMVAHAYAPTEKNEGE